jgi:hypothetical protein
MKYINTILLWVLAGVSVVVLVLFGMAETENVQLTNGQFTEVSTQLDTFITWLTVAVGFGMILLPVSIIVDTILGRRSLLIVVASVIVLYYINYFISGETEFSRVVNGETQVFTEETMKSIDAWLYTIYELVAATVVLIVGFGAKRAILK